MLSIKVFFCLHVFGIFSFISGAFLFFKDNNSINHKKLLSVQFLNVFLWGFGLSMFYSKLDQVLSVWDYFGLFFQSLSLILFWFLISSHKNKKFLVIGSEQAPLSFSNAGPFKYIRHPFYFAYILNYLSIFLSNHNMVYFIAMVILCFIYNQLANEEEKYFLNSEFKNEYFYYQSHTDKFIPFLIKTKKLVRKCF